MRKEKKRAAMESKSEFYHILRRKCEVVYWIYQKLGESQRKIKEKKQHIEGKGSGKKLRKHHRERNYETMRGTKFRT